MTLAVEPVRTHEPVLPEWIDYNGHLSEPYYVLVLGHATDAVMDAVGLGPAYRSEQHASLFTIEAHVRYLDQVGPGAMLETRSWVIGSGPKTLWLWHELWVDDRLRASEEILGVHVDTDAGRSTPLPLEVFRRAEAYRILPPPDASRSIELI